MKRVLWLGLVLSIMTLSCLVIAGCGDSDNDSSDGDSVNFTTTQGTLEDGTAWRIDYPDNWNGVLLVNLDYASRDPLDDSSTNNITSYELLKRGYATSGTTRTISGWSLHFAAANAVKVQEIFKAKYGEPDYALEFGSSQGGHVAAMSVQTYPERWDGAIATCGGLSGAIGQWQGKLDVLFVAKALLAPASDLPVINIPEDWETNAWLAWQDMLADAWETPEGKVRIALAAKLAQLPEWADSEKEIPAADDLEGRLEGLYDAFVRIRINLLRQTMSSRYQIETLSGGNISSNVGVDYEARLAIADPDGLIAQLYTNAGLSLADDLQALADAPRYSADPDAISYFATSVFDGNLQVPVITVNGLGDAISVPAAQQAYESVVSAAGKQDMLRQTYTQSAGHCGFTASENIAAIETLIARIDNGTWDDTDAATMNGKGLAIGGSEPRFIDYTPVEFTSPYTACDLSAELEAAGATPFALPGQTLPVCSN